MTHWDKIYKNFLKTGDRYATLGEPIHPELKRLLARSTFEKKRVLDICCGEGKYLAFLERKGFQIDGIDSSALAIKMSRKRVKSKKAIKKADMFKFKIPKNRYDLIISIAAIHHGRKPPSSRTIAKNLSRLTSKW